MSMWPFPHKYKVIFIFIFKDMLVTNYSLLPLPEIESKIYF